jgi:hypothetical protein
VRWPKDNWKNYSLKRPWFRPTSLFPVPEPICVDAKAPIFPHKAS